MLTRDHKAACLAQCFGTCARRAACTGQAVLIDCGLSSCSGIDHDIVSNLTFMMTTVAMDMLLLYSSCCAPLHWPYVVQTSTWVAGKSVKVYTYIWLAWIPWELQNCNAKFCVWMLHISSGTLCSFIDRRLRLLVVGQTTTNQSPAAGRDYKLHTMPTPSCDLIATQHGNVIIQQKRWTSRALISICCKAKQKMQVQQVLSSVSKYT